VLLAFSTVQHGMAAHRVKRRTGTKPVWVLPVILITVLDGWSCFSRIMRISASLSSGSSMQKESRKVREFRRREQEILDTALKLFLEQGEDSVTVEMIADEVGIGKGTIYKHFKSKAEIYLRLMLDYERDLAELLHSDAISKDKAALPREYFAFRMSDPERYRLFDRLEEKVVKANQLPDLVEELHGIRASNFNHLTGVIQQRIEEGSLENVPAYFHYCAAWALVHGAMSMHHSPFWREVIKDQDGYTQFLMDVGVRMGNRFKRRKENEQA